MYEQSEYGLLYEQSEYTKYRLYRLLKVKKKETNPMAEKLLWVESTEQNGGLINQAEAACYPSYLIRLEGPFWNLYYDGRMLSSSVTLRLAKEAAQNHHDRNGSALTGQTVTDWQTPQEVQRVAVESKAEETDMAKRSGTSQLELEEKEPKTSSQKQKILNDLLWKHGKNLVNWANFPEILRKVGLTRDEVTPQMIATGQAFVKQHIARCDNNSVLSWLDPVHGDIEQGTAKTQTWASKCGMYKIVRVEGSHPRFAAIARVSMDGAGERLVGEQYGNLRAALDAVEDYHRGKMDLPEVTSNKNAIVAAAEELGLARKPRMPGTEPVVEAKPVPIITEEQKVDPKEEVDRLAERLQKRERLLEQRKHDNARTTKHVGVRGEVDRFGSRIGSSNAIVNAALSRTPMSFKQIIEATGLSPKQVRYKHLDSLVANGFAVKSKEGWSLA